MLVVIEPNFCEDDARESACSINSGPRLDGVSLLTVSFSDRHLERVAAGASTRAAGDSQPNEVVQHHHGFARLLSVTGTAQVVLEVFEPITNHFKVRLTFLKNTDGVTVIPQNCRCTPICVSHSVDDHEGKGVACADRRARTLVIPDGFQVLISS